MPAIDLRRDLRGRPAAYPGERLVGVGIGLNPAQAQRLRDYANARGTSVSVIVRGLVERFEQENGLLGAQRE
jgi:hypothetical protein